jgi:hypothetical protein
MLFAASLKICYTVFIITHQHKNFECRNFSYICAFQQSGEGKPVLRGFSRNVKQDSVANAVSGEMSEANVGPPLVAVSGTRRLNLA